MLCWSIYVVRRFVTCNLMSVSYHGLDRAQLHAQFLNEHASVTLLLSYLVLPSVSFAQFRAIDCHEFNGGQFYLRIDTSLYCGTETVPSKEYRGMLLVDIPFILLYQSLPVLYMFLLLTNRRRLNPGLRNDNASRRKRDRDPRISALNFLFCDYQVGFYWFEVFEMYRRCIFTAILPFVDKNFRPIAGCFLAALSIIVFEACSPYHDTETNSLAIAAQWQLFITYFCAYVISSGTFDTKRQRFALGVFLICVNVVVVVLDVVLGSAKNRRREHNEYVGNVKSTSIHPPTNTPSPLRHLTLPVAS